MSKGGSVDDMNMTGSFQTSRWREALGKKQSTQ